MNQRRRQVRSRRLFHELSARERSSDFCEFSKKVLKFPRPACINPANFEKLAGVGQHSEENLTENANLS
jgi:hypothetical protein